MTRFSQVLSLLLAAQLLISVAVFWPREERGNQDARSAILSLSQDSIDRIEISDGSGDVQLLRGDQGWTLPDYFSLPVDQASTETVLTALPSQPRGWPVASSDSAAERFEVAEDRYQRRVRFYQTDSLVGEIYLGSSPGFRKVHSRPGDNRQVYAIEFSSFDLPMGQADWLDKRVLQLDADITAFTGLDYQITQSQDASWKDPEGAPAQQADVDQLINGLKGLRVTAAADPATTELLRQMEVPANLKVTTASGNYGFRLFEIEDAHYIQREDIPVFFSISAFDYDRLNKVSAASLFPPAAEPSTESETPEG